MTAILGAIWPYLLTAASVLGALLFGWSQKKSADTAKAQAGEQVAQAQTAAAQANTQTAEVRDAESQANAVAAQAGAQSVKERANVESDVGALPAGSAADQLRDGWSSDSTGGTATGSSGKDAGR